MVLSLKGDTFSALQEDFDAKPHLLIYNAPHYIFPFINIPDQFVVPCQRTGLLIFDLHYRPNLVVKRWF